MSKDILDRYKQANHKLPGTMLRWRLFGAGFDKFGEDGRTSEVPLPEYRENELLMRVDACGICFSDVKLIRAGGGHPRLYDRDLENEPVTPGHEVAFTVTGVGDKLKDRFKVGDRFIIQADVLHKGKGVAYGYVIDGGFAQYSLIGEEILEGDEGCYLLPVDSEIGYAEAALVEPWTCVEAAYDQPLREGPKPGGCTWVIGNPELEHGLKIPPGFSPGQLVLTNVGRELRDLLKTSVGQDAAIIDEYQLDSTADPERVRKEFTGGKGFDDIWVLLPASADVLGLTEKCLADNGILNLVAPKGAGSLSSGIDINADIGRLHYCWTRYLSALEPDFGAAYRQGIRKDLAPGGRAWLPGAGGPMGQMHFQRALLHPNPPELIVATDLSQERLDVLNAKFGGAASSRGIEVHYINVADLPEEEVRDRLDEVSGGRKYTDVVVLAPAPRVCEMAVGLLADGGLLNIFAGVSVGTTIRLDLYEIAARQKRIVGHSGSTVKDLANALRKTESHAIQPNYSVAAVAGLGAVREGLDGVAKNIYPGKVVVFPQIEDLPITHMAELKDSLPTVAEKLVDGCWTREAEEELLRIKLHPLGG